MNRELLEKPFEPNLIKERKGNFGQNISYVEGLEVIKRLNDAFDCHWSFTVISHEVLEAEVVVLGELVAEGIKKMQFGSSAITRAQETGKLISLGDDLKAATTDCLKKCATMLGVGLHLYGESKARPAERTSARQRGDSSRNSGTLHTSTHHRSTTHSSTNPDGTQHPSNDTSTNQNGRISSKQHQYIISLGQDLGWSKQELDRRSIEGYGSAIAYLSKKQASEIIQSMRQH